MYTFVFIYACMGSGNYESNSPITRSSVMKINFAICIYVDLFCASVSNVIKKFWVGYILLTTLYDSNNTIAIVIVIITQFI